MSQQTTNQAQKVRDGLQFFSWLFLRADHHFLSLFHDVQLEELSERGSAEVLLRKK